MSNSSKVYVIDPKTGRSTGTVKSSERVEYRPETPTGAPSGSDAATKQKSSRKDPARKAKSGESTNRRKDSPALTMLSYLLGPLAILSIKQGRKSRAWLSIALSSSALSVIALWRCGSIFSRPATGSFADGVWIFLGCVAVAAAFTAWAYAAVLIGRHKSAALRRLPAWLGHQAAVGTMGVLVPGLGLFITGHSRRAAFAVWMAGAVLLSTLVLSHAGWLWRWNEATGAVAIAPHTLEYLFLVLGVVGLLGALTWIVQALDGTRFAGSRASRGIQVRGDLLAGMLLAVIAVFAVTFEPALVALTLDEFAVSAYGEGLKIIPLHASLNAALLDPSRPAYVLHAASIYEDLGMDNEARALRIELWNRWEPCVEVFEKEGRLSQRVKPVSQEQAPVTGQDVPSEPVADRPIDVAPKETGRLATWDRLDALYGIFAIEDVSTSVDALE